MPRLLLLNITDNQTPKILSDYGDFEKQEAEIFFSSALDSIARVKHFEGIALQNQTDMFYIMQTLKSSGLVIIDQNGLRINGDGVHDLLRAAVQKEMLRYKANDKAISYMNRQISRVRLMFFNGFFSGLKVFFSKLIDKIKN